MKTIKLTTALFLSLIISAMAFSSNSIFEMEEEAYINDIPFNTADIKDKCLYDMAMSQEFEMEEESYIDDIPFDTECIAVDCLYYKAMNVDFDLPEESYIDDIPFDTSYIASNLVCKR